VLAALFGRERSGVGETLRTSLLEVSMHLQATTWSDYMGGAPEPTRIGDGQPNNAPASEVVATRDGHIVLSAYAEEHWARFCRVVGREALATDPRFATNALRVKNRPALRVVLSECLSAYTSEECVQLLSRNQIVVGAVRTYSQVLQSPDVKASGMLVAAQDADGARYQALGLPYRLGDAPRATPPVAPACGADTQSVLEGLGFAQAQIDEMRRAGAVA
jgi:crotonobetainyl-CoA:carnitine CoA-transferase CaiB-like acyl-CoA transferase